ncbi:Tim44/TimA family putative adaptor protein [Oceanomicrobium pacificus]|uniref:Tim44/TimA family putative adaptor protein n=1 Tax=Oceanomicrobium pacificus TaxID=2692916 RepID=A0A6B0TUV3_9RHOB|nr:Tim44/TimA family putative adaptor protein [Oceanomicrobium pacificus]MXU64723.1 Tim44/TimA family putative adaptor protein [Oceanomicrobium pacificus]
MGSAMVQILILAAIAVFLVLRLRSVLGTRDGFEAPPEAQKPAIPESPADNGRFEVIDGGGVDHDIADYVEADGPAGQAITKMKAVEPGFRVHDFAHGARAAYEMILMAFENGDLKTLETFLSPEVYESFRAVVEDRADKGLEVDATFIGVRELRLVDAKFDEDSREADITMKFVGELTSVVRDAEGNVVEGDATTARRQRDIWTFSRVMGSDDPNWLLTATGE